MVLKNRIISSKIKRSKVTDYAALKLCKQSLRFGKATSQDAINNRVLKELVQPLSFPLSDILNFSPTSGKVPLIWKEEHVTPIFKKDDSTVVSNYSSISLLSTVGKVLEK